MDEVGPEPLRPSDFLVIFEELCSLIPALIVIFYAPVYIGKAFNNRRYIQISRLFWLKLAVVGILSAVQINIVFCWWHAVPAGTRLARATAHASYVGMPSLVLISCIEHLYSLRQSSFLTLFLLTTLLADVAAFPTYFYPPGLGDIKSPHWTFVALKLSLFVLEQFPKRRFVEHGSSANGMDNVSDESGFCQAPLWKLAKSNLFVGFSSKIGNGFFPDLEDEAGAEILYKAFLPQWETGWLDHPHLRRFCSLTLRFSR